MEPSPELLREIVRRTVAAVAPLRIVLFGSGARGEFGPDSDLDLLVVMPDGSDRLATAQTLHRRLRGLGCAVDIVAVLQDDVDLLGDNPFRVIHTALSQGRELYHVA